MDTLIGQPIALDDRDIQTAQGSASVLSRYLNGLEKPVVRMVNQDHETEEVQIPAAAFRLLVQILDQLGRGNAVMCVPVHAELTTQQAADLLNVSRPYVVKLLEEGAIPFSRTGTHRRVRLEDVMEYKRRRQAARREAMKELVRESEKLGLYS